MMLLTVCFQNIAIEQDSTRTYMHMYLFPEFHLAEFFFQRNVFCKFGK